MHCYQRVRGVKNQAFERLRRGDNGFGHCHRLEHLVLHAPGDPQRSDRGPVCISQSGETADTLAALRQAKADGAPALGICNVQGSMLTREAKGTIYTHAGPEIGVASTKAFTSQLVALVLLAIKMARARGTLNDTELSELIGHLYHIPAQMEEYLSDEKQIIRLAKQYQHHRDFLYLGRGVNYPIALEGALKLKEISYIHAESYT